MDLQLDFGRILFDEHFWRVEKIASFSLDVGRSVDLNEESLRTDKRRSDKCCVDFDVFIGGLIMVNCYVLTQRLRSISQRT